MAVMPLRRGSAAPTSPARAALAEGVATHAEASRRLTAAQSALSRAEQGVLEAGAAAIAAEDAIARARDAAIDHEVAMLKGGASGAPPRSVASAREDAQRASDRLGQVRAVRDRLAQDAAGAESDVAMASLDLDAAQKPVLRDELRGQLAEQVQQGLAGFRRYVDALLLLDLAVDWGLTDKGGPDAIVGLIELRSLATLNARSWAPLHRAHASPSRDALRAAVERLRMDASASLTLD